jgi:hypothetical protein
VTFDERWECMFAPGMFASGIKDGEVEV